jgi:hypothetical protein
MKKIMLYLYRTKNLAFELRPTNESGMSIAHWSCLMIRIPMDRRTQKLKNFTSKSIYINSSTAFTIEAAYHTSILNIVYTLRVSNSSSKEQQNKQQAKSYFTHKPANYAGAGPAVPISQ